MNVDSALVERVVTDIEAWQGRNRDQWVPACGGTEQPFVCRGRRLHYMWNRLTREHAYLDLAQDRFLSTDEALEILMPS